jgi:hypothetical protein
MLKKRMPVGESQQDTTTIVAAPPGGRCWVTVDDALKLTL